MKSNSSKPGCSISLNGMVLLTIALVVLKAYDKIQCSWLWVFAPIWIPLSIGVVVVAIWFAVWFWANTYGRKW